MTEYDPAHPNLKPSHRTLGLVAGEVLEIPRRRAGRALCVACVGLGMLIAAGLAWLASH
jgi:hypothetical protein